MHDSNSGGTRASSGSEPILWGRMGAWDPDGAFATGSFDLREGFAGVLRSSLTPARLAVAVVVASRTKGKRGRVPYRNVGA